MLIFPYILKSCSKKMHKEVIWKKIVQVDVSAVYQKLLL